MVAESAESQKLPDWQQNTQTDPAQEGGQCTLLQPPEAAPAEHTHNRCVWPSATGRWDHPPRKGWPPAKVHQSWPALEPAPWLLELLLEVEDGDQGLPPQGLLLDDDMDN